MMTFKENETCARSRTQWLVLIILTQLSGRCVSGYIGCKACRRRVASNGSSRVFSSGTTAAASGCYWHWICSTGSFQSLLKGFLLLCVSWWGPVHLCNPALFGSGLGLWWLITIHLAAAVNIDSSRDFQFEPCDILWNITKCVEVRKEIGRRGGRSGPQGRWITPLRWSSPCSCLSICLTPALLSVWGHWVERELVFSECCASSSAYRAHWSLTCSQLFSVSDPLHSGPGSWIQRTLLLNIRLLWSSGQCFYYSVNSYLDKVLR